MRQACLRSCCPRSPVPLWPGMAPLLWRSRGDLSGLEEGTSYTGDQVAMNGFCSWGNVEGKTLSQAGVFIHEAFLAVVPKGTREISQVAAYFSLSKDCEGSKGRHILGAWTRCFVSLSLHRKTGEEKTSRSSLGQWKRNGIWCGAD